MLSELAFSTKSDVWSFGVVLFEIASDGKMPFETLDSIKVKQRVLNGGHVDMPRGCHSAIDDLATACFAVSPSERPSFASLEAQLRTAAVKANDLVHSSSASTPAASAIVKIDPPPRRYPTSAAAAAAATGDTQGHYLHLGDALFSPTSSDVGTRRSTPRGSPPNGSPPMPSIPLRVMHPRARESALSHRPLSLLGPGVSGSRALRRGLREMSVDRAFADMKASEAASSVRHPAVTPAVATTDSTTPDDATENGNAERPSPSDDTSQLQNFMV